METIYLVLAIDGTASIEYSHDKVNQQCTTHLDHTQRFYSAVNVPASQKMYLHGPASGWLNLNAATGWDSGEIFFQGWKWLKERLRVFPKAFVVLVGHSRGGHIVTEIAIRLSKYNQGEFAQSRHRFGPTPLTSLLPALNSGNNDLFGPAESPKGQPVQFLGLFDTVDMTLRLGSSLEIPTNVEWFYHAKRNKDLGNRSGWGNTAVNFPKENKQYAWGEFGGTHGALGGAFPEGCSGGLTTKKAIAKLVGGLGGYVADQYFANIDGSCSYPLSVEENTKASNSAYNEMLKSAKQAGVPF